MNRISLGDIAAVIILFACIPLVGIASCLEWFA